MPTSYLMQMHSSYVVTDPKGTILVECGKMLQRGAPKLGKDGKPVKDKHGKADVTGAYAPAVTEVRRVQAASPGLPLFLCRYRCVLAGCD